MLKNLTNDEWMGTVFMTEYHMVLARVVRPKLWGPTVLGLPLLLTLPFSLPLIPSWDFPNTSVNLSLMGIQASKTEPLGNLNGSVSLQFSVTSTRWRNTREEPAYWHQELRLQEHQVREELPLLSALHLLPGPASRLSASSSRRQPSQNTPSSSSPTLSFVQGNPEKTLTLMHVLSGAWAGLLLSGYCWAEHRVRASWCCFHAWWRRKLSSGRS